MRFLRSFFLLPLILCREYEDPLFPFQWYLVGHKIIQSYNQILRSVRATRQEEISTYYQFGGKVIPK
jgi:hypothetical protein